MNFPKTISFKSDDTICELKKEVTESKIAYGLYVYKKAVAIEKGGTFLGSEIKFSKTDIERLLKKEIITCQ